MISKALFKQSCKANWVKWLSVTLSTCVMLAIIIIVLGNLQINDIRDSLKGVFTQANEEAYLKENSVDLYELYLTSAETSNTSYKQLSAIFTEYDNAKNIYKQYVGGRELEQNELTIVQNQVASAFVNNLYPNLIEPEKTQAELQAFVIDCLNIYETDSNLGVTKFKNILYDIIPNQIAYGVEINGQEENKTEEEIASSKIIAQMISNDAIENYIEQSNKSGFSYSRKAFTQIATDYINGYMYNMVYMSQIAGNTSEENAKINATAVKVISNTAITTYEFYINEYTNADESNITSEYKTSARNEACKSISDQIPDKVAVALQELGNMDIYDLIIGSIFYKIAGLLLPMVFVIMTANGLIASQVDSGSMAYVLSTPTKRKTVACTQLLYLTFALFTMYALLTIISTLSVWIAGGNSFSINFKEILLLNLGSFMTMFAIAGFCFMCSAIFNRSKHSLSIGGGLTIFSLVCTILGLFGSNVVPSAMRISQMNFFNYLSIITLFDVNSILNGGINYLWKFAILIGFGIITMIIGIIRFDKKDLPL